MSQRMDVRNLDPSRLEEGAKSQPQRAATLGDGSPPDGRSRLDSARAADAKWRADRWERHALRVKRLQARIRKMELGTGRLVLMMLVGSLSGVTFGVVFQVLQGRNGLELAREYFVPSVFGLSAITALTAAFTEGIFRWRLRKLVERGWREGIEAEAGGDDGAASV